ncbi:MAG: YSC84-related protein [Campylobacterota bacterium]|nr:YSC84-related protein [Campylobacterota bacterium]
MKIWKLIVAVIFIGSSSLSGATAQEIDRDANRALEKFNKELKGAVSFVQNDVKALLIFPSIVKAGIGIGGEYGEGVLRIKGKSNIYYSTASASVGLQFGVQEKSMIIAFMTQAALDKFLKSDGWEVGVDGSVTLIDVGMAKNISTQRINKPVVGFVFNNKGLMYNLTIEGSKFTKIVR